MKRVHNTEQLMHLFCNMTEANLEGFRTPSRNVYVERGVLYSYGPHYPIAKFYTRGEGLLYTEYLLINSNKSSVTTEKHKRILRNSTQPLQITIDVPYPVLGGDTSASNEQYLINRICDLITEILNGRKYASLGYVQEAINELNLYRNLEYWLLYRKELPDSKRFKLPDDFEFDLNILVRQRVDKTLKQDQEKAAKALLKLKDRAEKTLTHLPLWLAHGPFNFKSALNIVSTNTPTSSDMDNLAKYKGHDFCRITTKVERYATSPDNVIDKDKKILITQRGAEVPYRVVLRLIATGDEFGYHSIVGQNAGAFTIDEYDESKGLLKIGCHTINIQQVKNAVTGFQTMMGEL